jgi:phosphomannomutase/phosphoglucomutase
MIPEELHRRRRPGGGRRGSAPEGESTVKSSYFREYDIRGIVGDGLDEADYHRLGLAFGTYLDRHGDRTACVGRDVRPSSPAFAEALGGGLAETGRRVLDLGLVSTPMTVFGLNYLGADASVAVTASHNPSEYNGAKVRRREPVFGEELQALRRIFEKGDFVAGRGAREPFDMLPAYVDAVRGRVRAGRALKVVVDAGNGSGALVAPELLDALGFKVVPLHCEPDGTFPAHHPDPTKPENLEDLIEAIEREGADGGVAFDGDADRMAFVDETGTIHWPDRLLMLMALRLLPRRPGGVVVHDVKCSRGVAQVVSAAGGTPLMVRTGYPFVLEAMKTPGAILGAELSGHCYFGEDPLFNFDDGVFAAARFLDCLSQDPRPPSRQLADLPPSVASPELRLTVPEERKFAIAGELTELFRADRDVVELLDVDGARATYPEGWGLVRASNTQPDLVLVFEAEDETGLERVKRRFREKLARFAEIEGTIP